MRSTRKVRSPGFGVGHQIPVGALGGQAERVHDAPARLPIAGHVAQGDLLALDDGLLNGVEQRRRRPRGESAHPIRPDPRRPRPRRPRRRCVTVRARRAPACEGRPGAAGRPGGGRSGDRNRARASPAVRPLRSVAPPSGQPPAPVAALLRINGHAGHAQSVEVTARRALRHLKLLGHFGGRHLPSGLEKQENGHQTVGAHPPTFQRKVAIT